jgi:hypothetical protein
VTYVATRPPMRAVCFRNNQSTPQEALMSMVAADERRDWVGKSNWGSDLKGAGYGHFDQHPPYMFFAAAADLISGPPDRAAPLAAAALLGDGVKLHSHGFVCSTVRALVDFERARFPSVASPLSAARSNTHAPLLICPYPFRKKKSQAPPSPPYRRVCEIVQSRKTCRIRRGGDLVMEFGYYDCLNPPYMALR